MAFVQRGNVTIASGQTTVTIALGEPIPIGRSWWTISCRSEDYRPAQHFASAELTTIDDGCYTEIRFTRGNSTSSCIVEWQVITGEEFTVQSGTHTIATVVDSIIIDEVDPDSSFPVISGRIVSTSATALHSFVSAEITTATTLELKVSNKTYPAIVSWQVISWEGATVIHGTLATSAGGSQTGYLKIAEKDTYLNTLVVSSRRTTATTQAGSAGLRAIIYPVPYNDPDYYNVSYTNNTSYGSYVSTVVVYAIYHPNVSTSHVSEAISAGSYTVSVDQEVGLPEKAFVISGFPGDSSCGGEVSTGTLNRMRVTIQLTQGPQVTFAREVKVLGVDCVCWLVEFKEGIDASARGGAESGGRAQGETYSIIPGAAKGGVASGGRAWGENLPYKTGQARGGAVAGGRAGGMVERIAAARGGMESGGRVIRRIYLGAARGGAVSGGHLQAVIVKLSAAKGGATSGGRAEGQWEIFIPSLQPARELRAKVFVNETEYDDRSIASIILDETVNPTDSFAIGTAASAKLELALIDIPESTNLDGAIIKPYIGFVVKGEVVEYIPLGVFNAEEIDWQKDSRITRAALTCFDNMVCLETAYILSNLTYPASLRSVAQEIAQKAGVTFNAASLAALPTTPVDELMGYTLREAIGFVASFVGGYACFNRAGELEIRAYQNEQSLAANIRPMNCRSFKTSENEFTIGRLACRVGEDEEGNPAVLTAGITGNEVQFDNPLMTQEQLDAIHAALSQLSYMPYELHWQGDPALRAGDLVSIADKKGNVYQTYIMEQQLRYVGGLSATAEAKGKTELAQEFQSAGPLTQALNRVSGLKAYADRLVQMLVDGEFEGGTFIDGNMVVSPIIAGMEARITGEIKVGGLDSNVVGISGDGSDDSSIRIWAGNQDKTIAPLRITQAGKLYASDVDIKGKVVASSGSFSGGLAGAYGYFYSLLAGDAWGARIELDDTPQISVYDDYDDIRIKIGSSNIDIFSSAGWAGSIWGTKSGSHSLLKIDATRSVSIGAGGYEGFLARNSGNHAIDGTSLDIYASSLGVTITGDTYVFGSFGYSSGRESKEDIVPSSMDALNVVLDTPVYEFKFKEQVSGGPVGTLQHIGPMADELPEIVKMVRDGREYISAGDAIGLLWKAVQELDAKVDTLGGVK